MNDKTDLLRSLRIDRSGETEAGGAAAAPGWPIVLGAALGALVVGGALAWFLKPAPKPPPAAPVEQALAGSAATAPAGSLVASGYVVARRRATVAAEVTGRVLEVRVEEGQTVKRGQVLAVLDATLARAEAQSARARAAAAQAELAEARRALTRTQALAQRAFASDASLKTAQARLDTATAQRAAAAGEANQASAQLDRHLIRAPFAGVVVDKSAQAGEIISPMSAGGGFTRTGICTIVDMESLEVEVDVNEAYIARVSAGQKVEAVLDAYPGDRFAGHVIATIPTASRDKATVRVRIGFDRLDPRILPDMAIKVTFLSDRS